MHSQLEVKKLVRQPPTNKRHCMLGWASWPHNYIYTREMDSVAMAVGLIL